MKVSVGLMMVIGFAILVVFTVLVEKSKTRTCTYYNTVQVANCSVRGGGKYRVATCRVEFIDKTRKTLRTEALLKGDILYKCQYSDILRGIYNTRIILKE